jgi:hypothetical protein
VTKEPTPPNGSSGISSGAPNGSQPIPNSSGDKDTVPDLPSAMSRPPKVDTKKLGSLGTDQHAQGSSPKNEPPSSPSAASAGIAAGSTPAPEAEVATPDIPPAKKFDPWHFGAITIPPELIKEYDQAMQRFESGEGPPPEHKVETDPKAQAYKDGWGKPLSQQFSEEAARLAQTQASRVRVREARTRQLAMGAVAILGLFAFAVLWWSLAKSKAPLPQNETESAVSAVPEVPTQAAATETATTIPPPPPPEIPDPALPEEAAAAAPTPPAPVPTPAQPEPATPARTPTQLGRAPVRPPTSPVTSTSKPAAPVPASTAAAEAASDDILGGPMTRRPKPKKTDP